MLCKFRVLPSSRLLEAPWFARGLTNGGSRSYMKSALPIPVGSLVEVFLREGPLLLAVTRRSAVGDNFLYSLTDEPSTMALRLRLRRVWRERIGGVRGPQADPANPRSDRPALPGGAGSPLLAPGPEEATLGA